MRSLRRLPIGVVGLFTVLTLTLSAAWTPSVAASSDTTSTTAGAEQSGVPNQAQLEAALLTLGDIGARRNTAQSPYQGRNTRQAGNTSQGGNTTVSGCEAFAHPVDGSSTTPGDVTAKTQFATSTDFPGTIVEERLVAVPAPSFEMFLHAATDGLASCQKLTLTDNQNIVTLDLTSTDFTEGSAAKKMSGSYEGSVPVNGYLAVQGISGNAALFFEYLQIGAGSSQDALRIYQMGVDKAKGAFPTS